MLDEDSSDNASSDEDILATYAPARTDVSSGLEHNGADPNDQALKGPSVAAQAAAAATLVSTLKARGGASQSKAIGVGSTTGSSARTGAGSPWSAQSSAVPDDRDNTTQLLESHESEQTALTDSLLTLASALKASTLSFSDSVTASNPLVEKTSEALDKNVGGMERASQNMGMLRKMTEGKGWWSRLGLWAKVGVLWVVLILVVFVMPKLRF